MSLRPSDVYLNTVSSVKREATGVKGEQNPPPIVAPNAPMRGSKEVQKDSTKPAYMAVQPGDIIDVM